MSAQPTKQWFRESKRPVRDAPMKVPIVIESAAALTVLLLAVSCGGTGDTPRTSPNPKTTSVNEITPSEPEVKYDVVETKTFIIDAGKDRSDQIEARIDHANDSLDHSRLIITNLSTGKVIYSENMDNFVTAINNAPYMLDDRPALILQWSSAAYDFVDVYSVDTERVSKLTDGLECRGTYFLLPQPGGSDFDIFVGSTNDYRDESYYVYRHSWNSTEKQFRANGKVRLADLRKQINLLVKG